MDILQCILPCNISALERIRKIILAIYISCFAKSIFQTRSKKSYISEILNVFLFQNYI